MRNQPEVRAPGRGHGVDLALIMTFKCLKPGEDEGYAGPIVEGGWGREGRILGAWVSSPQCEEKTHLPSPTLCQALPKCPISLNHHICLLKVLTLLLSILQRRKWRLREGKSVANRHTAGENAIQTGFGPSSNFKFLLLTLSYYGPSAVGTVARSGLAVRWE